MFNLDHALAAWRRSLRFNRAFSKDDLDELDAHLRDFIDHLQAQGLADEDAFHQALERLGLRHDIESEYRKVRWARPKRRRTLLNAFHWHAVMLKNYLKIALRTLHKEKSYAFINIFGLALGLAVCLLLFLFVRDEWTYDQFHEQADQLYRVNAVNADENGILQALGSTSLPLPLAPALEAEIPEVDAAIRVRTSDYYLRHEEGEAISAEVSFVDPAFTTTFSFEMLDGDAASALSTPQDLVLAEATAAKLFGSNSPMGQRVSLYIEGTYVDFTVSGVIQNPPGNSTIRYEALVPFAAFPMHHANVRENADNWNYGSVYTYVKLREGVQHADVRTALAGLYAKYHSARLDRLRERYEYAADVVPATFLLRSISDLHMVESSSPTYSYILLGIALGILVIACINFMTLTIGRSARRAMEVGVRKAIGAQRGQLMAQFWGEAFMLTAIAMLLGLLLAAITLPIFNGITGKSLARIELFSPPVLLTLFGLFVSTGFIAGSYPALLLSRFRPIETLSNRLRLSGANGLTKGLVIVQFALSVFLMVSMLVMSAQMQHTRTMNLGFDKDYVIVMDVQRGSGEGRDILQRLRNSLSSDPNVVGLTASGNSMGWRGTRGSIFGHGDHTHAINVFTVEADYFDFFDIPLASGRAFDPDRSSDSTQALVVNEALVREYQQVDQALSNPIGAEIPDYKRAEGTQIIGIVEDFHFNVLYQEVAPAMFALENYWGVNYIFARLAPHALSDGLAATEAAWTEAVPDLPFQYQFLDENMQRLYQDDQRWSTIVQYASFFAIFIACLGLLGLATLTTARRTKELGIRKVLGASVPRLVGLVARDFLWLVLAGIAIAVPVGLVVMQKWLEDFAYRIELGPMLFIVGAVLALALAASVVSLQAFRAARANPVDSLRYE
ncbi:MAG: ABC transporter permease [Rhodothermales bacterium]